MKHACTNYLLRGKYSTELNKENTSRKGAASVGRSHRPVVACQNDKQETKIINKIIYIYIYKHI